MKISVPNYLQNAVSLPMAHVVVLRCLRYRHIHLVMCLWILMVVGHSLMHVCTVRLAGGRWISCTLAVVRGVPLLHWIAAGLVRLLHHRVLSGRKLLFLFLLMAVTHRLLSISAHLPISVKKLFKRGTNNDSIFIFNSTLNRS